MAVCLTCGGNHSRQKTLLWSKSYNVLTEVSNLGSGSTTGRKNDTIIEAKGTANASPIAATSNTAVDAATQ